MIKPEQPDIFSNEVDQRNLIEETTIPTDEPISDQTEFTVEDVKLFKKAKKGLKKILIESGAAGLLTVLLGFAGCRAPLPIILAALEATQATGEQCKSVVAEAAAGTIGLEFFAGAGAYAFVRAIAKKLEDPEECEE